MTSHYLTDDSNALIWIFIVQSDYQLAKIRVRPLWTQLWMRSGRRGGGAVNGRLRVNFQGARVTSDGGLLLVQELGERLGLGELIVRRLTDPRGRNTQLPLISLVRQSIYSRLAGYQGVNDAGRLSQDPAFRLIGSRKVCERGAVLTSRPQSFETEVLTQTENLARLAAINRRWSLDFVSDALGDGRRFRILCVVDDFSRECLACVVDTSIGGVRVARELERLVMERGLPGVMVSDNGCELTSTAVLRWSLGRLDWRCIAPASPCKMPSSNPATAACATNALTSMYS